MYEIFENDFQKKSRLWIEDLTLGKKKMEKISRASKFYRLSAFLIDRGCAFV